VCVFGSCGSGVHIACMCAHAVVRSACMVDISHSRHHVLSVEAVGDEDDKDLESMHILESLTLMETVYKKPPSVTRMLFPETSTHSSSPPTVQRSASSSSLSQFSRFTQLSQFAADVFDAPSLHSAQPPPQPPYSSSSLTLSQGAPVRSTTQDQAPSSAASAPFSTVSASMAAPSASAIYAGAGGSASQNSRAGASHTILTGGSVSSEDRSGSGVGSDGARSRYELSRSGGKNQDHSGTAEHADATHPPLERFLLQTMRVLHLDRVRAEDLVGDPALHALVPQVRVYVCECVRVGE
jgi:hypothetical protein